MLRGQTRRAQDQPARDAVELDERQCGCELILHGDEDRATMERRQRATQARAARERLESDARAGSPEMAAGRWRVVTKEVTQRLEAFLLAATCPVSVVTVNPIDIARPTVLSSALIAYMRPTIMVKLARQLWSISNAALTDSEGALASNQ